MTPALEVEAPIKIDVRLKIAGRGIPFTNRLKSATHLRKIPDLASEGFCPAQVTPISKHPRSVIQMATGPLKGSDYV